MPWRACLAGWEVRFSLEGREAMGSGSDAFELDVLWIAAAVCVDGRV